MRRPLPIPQGAIASQFWDLLTFDRLMTNGAVHLIYWSGLGLILMGAFGAIGAAVGVALREANLQGILLAIPLLVGGLLMMAVLGLLWRSFCEFYVTIFKISEDLHALRLQADRDGQVRRPPVREI